MFRRRSLNDQFLDLICVLRRASFASAKEDRYLVGHRIAVLYGVLYKNHTHVKGKVLRCGISFECFGLGLVNAGPFLLWQVA